MTTLTQTMQTLAGKWRICAASDPRIDAAEVEYFLARTTRAADRWSLLLIEHGQGDEKSRH